MDFVQARWFHQGRKGNAIRLFVIHDAEAPEKSTTAEAVARYFSTTDRKASAHYVTDSDSSVQCVRDADSAFGAAGANNDGLHFEQAGYARQTREEWLDPYGLAMFDELGVLLRAKSVEHAVPLRWLTIDQIRDGITRGLCTHADISKAFPNVSTGHTDPGPNFPKDVALATWLGVDPTPPEEPDMDADDKKRLATIEQYAVNASQGGIVDWDQAGGDLNGFGVTDDGACLQVFYAEGRITRRVLVPTGAVRIFAGPRQFRTRTDVMVELHGGVVRWLTADATRPGFPGRGDLPPEAHLVPDGDGWHYIDIAP